jgi:hypothetical protein
MGNIKTPTGGSQGKPQPVVYLRKIGKQPDRPGSFYTGDIANPSGASAFAKTFNA